MKCVQIKIKSKIYLGDTMGLVISGHSLVLQWPKILVLQWPKIVGLTSGGDEPRAGYQIRFCAEFAFGGLRAHLAISML